MWFSSRVIQLHKQWPFGALMVLTLAWLAEGCGARDPGVSAAASASCPSNLAEILVQDGFMKIVCGCTETAGTVTSRNQTLTCTISRTTSVMFNYAGSHVTHQIVSTASNPAFTPSPLGVPAFVVPFNTSGTFGFVDHFDSGLLGSIVVN